MVTSDEKFTFSKELEDFIKEQDYDYVEGLLVFCEEKGIDEEDIKGLISDKIRGLLEKEAFEQGYLKYCTNIDNL